MNINPVCVTHASHWRIYSSYSSSPWLLRWCLLTSQDTNCCSPPTRTLCSASPYLHPHQWTILAFSDESGHSRTPGRLPQRAARAEERREKQGECGLGGTGRVTKQWKEKEGERERKREREGDGEYNFRTRQHRKLFSVDCFLLDFLSVDRSRQVMIIP